MTKFEIEEKIVSMLKTVFDPEIPVNVYDLGLIYKIDVSDQGEASIDMTLTAPNCPAADFIMEDVRQKVESIDGVTSATINLVFEPEWDKDMMSEEAKLELGFLYISSRMLTWAHEPSNTDEPKNGGWSTSWTASSTRHRPYTCWETCSTSGTNSVP